MRSGSLHLIVSALRETRINRRTRCNICILILLLFGRDSQLLSSSCLKHSIWRHLHLRRLLRSQRLQLVGSLDLRTACLVVFQVLLEVDSVRLRSYARSLQRRLLFVITDPSIHKLCRCCRLRLRLRPVWRYLLCRCFRWLCLWSFLSSIPVIILGWHCITWRNICDSHTDLALRTAHASAGYHLSFHRFISALRAISGLGLVTHLPMVGHHGLHRSWLAIELSFRWLFKVVHASRCKLSWV